MSYGLRTYTAGGNIVLDITDRTPRLITTVTAVTVPSLGSTSTVSVSGATTDSVILSTSGNYNNVTTNGTVNVYGVDGGGTTNLKILAY